MNRSNGINQFHENILPLVLFILLAVLYFHEYIFGGMAPFGRDDAITYQPMRWFFLDAMRTGDSPLWNPYIGFGHPMAAESQCTVLHPLTFLFFILPFYKAYIASIVICYPLFAFFLYRLCRAWGLHREGALFGATVVTYGGAYLIWQGHFSIISTLVWFPLMLMYLVKACRGGRAGSMAVASMLYALMIFSGAPQFTYMGTVFAILFLLTIGDAGKPFPVKTVVRNSLPAFLLGAIIGAVQLLPLYELTTLSERMGPFFDPKAGTMSDDLLATLLSPIWYRHGCIETAPGAIYAYIGALGGALAITGIASSKRRLLPVILIAVFIAFSFGGITTLGMFREAWRMLFFAAVVLGMYGAYGLDRLISRGGNAARFDPRWVAALISIPLALAAATYFHPADARQYAGLLIPSLAAVALLFIIPVISRRMMSLAIVTAIIAGLAMSVYPLNWAHKDAAVPRAELERIPPVADALVDVVDEGRVWISVDADERDPLYFHDGVVGPRALMWDLETTDNETPLFVRGVMRFERYTLNTFRHLAEMESRGSTPRADVLAALKYIAVAPDVGAKLPYAMLHADGDSSPPFVIMENPDYMGEAFFIFPRDIIYLPDDDAGWDIDGFVFEEDGRVESVVLSGTQRDINPTPGRWSVDVIDPRARNDEFKVRYTAPPGSFLFISKVFYPGWKAYVNGKPTDLYRAYGIFCGVVVDEPEGVVELVYEAGIWKTGFIISSFGIIICLLILIPRRKRVFLDK